MSGTIRAELYRFSNGRNSWEYKRPNLTVAQAAYIAGLIDGEGSIYVKRCRKWLQAIISIGNTDRRCLDFCYEVLQAGNVKFWQPSRKNRRPIRSNKPLYSWYVGSRAEVLGIIKAIYPYLQIKKEQADAVLELLVSVEEIPVEQVLG